MEQRFNKPGFELIFGLSIILIFTLPAMISRQYNRPGEIRIKNGDTIMNRKAQRHLSDPERLRDLKKNKEFNGDRSLDQSKKRKVKMPLSLSDKGILSAH